MKNASTLKVTIIANCQARPVADFLTALDPSIEIEHVTIVHLAQARDMPDFDAAARRSDFIFSQFIADTYPVEFIRSNLLTQQHGDKVVFWPNIFFRGQTPDLSYMTPAKGGRIMGPLDAYHSRDIVDAWRAGHTVDATTRRLLAPDGSGDKAMEVALASLAELEARERHCHVRVSPMISALWRTQRLFFTFNHPTARLLVDVARKLLDHIGRPAGPTPPDHRVWEPLGRFVPPTWPGIATALDLRFETSTDTKGVDVTFSGGNVKAGTNAIHYSAGELIETSFRSYEAQRSLFEDFRFS